MAMPHTPDRGRVSVIIPCFNAEKWIVRTIRSCIEQGELLGEIIVVDDHSEDDSYQIVADLAQTHQDRIFLHRNIGKGGNNARNLGFRKSRFDFIQWLDADDALCPGKFEHQVCALNANPSVDLVYSDWTRVEFDETGCETRRTLERKQQSADFLGELLDDKWSVPCNYLIRRRLALHLDEIGAWDNHRPVSQDREYFTLAALLASGCLYVRGAFSEYSIINRNSVSRMNFARRLEHQMSLERRLKTEIELRIPESSIRNTYIRKLNSHVYNAFFYNRNITPPFIFLPWNLEYSIIHWKKLLILPVLYAGLVLRYMKTRQSQRSGS